MNYIDIVKAELTVDEGVRRKPYIDTRGKTSIGIGRNLTDNGLSLAEIDFLFGNDVATAEREARAVFSTFDYLSDNRKAVVINMAFNLGQQTLEQFHGLIAAVNGGDYNDAAAHMLSSRWAKEVGARAIRLADLMKKG